MYSHGIPHRIVILSVLLLKMAAIGMVQMLIEAAEYLDRRERGKVCLCCLPRSILFMKNDIDTHPPSPCHAPLCTCHFKAFLNPVTLAVLHYFCYYYYYLHEGIRPFKTSTWSDIAQYSTYNRIHKKVQIHIQAFLWYSTHVQTCICISANERMNAYVVDAVRCAGAHCFHRGPSFPSVVVC